jgi:hypothetical protein
MTMSITSAKVTDDTADVAETGVRTYTRTLLVRTSEPSSSAAVRGKIASEASLPGRGTVHPDDATAKVVNISISRVDDSMRDFRYEARYSSEITALDVAEDPLDDPNRVIWSSTEVEEAYFINQDNNKVVNSIGQQFEQLPTRFGVDWEVTVVVNEAAYNVSTALSNVAKVNSANFDIKDGKSTWTIPTDNALLVEFAPGELQERNGIEYYEVRYRFKLNPDGWNASEKFLDYGTYELDGTDWKPVVDSTGNDILERFPLNGSGVRQPAGTDAAELSFKPYETANFATLPVG